MWYQGPHGQRIEHFPGGALAYLWTGITISNCLRLKLPFSSIPIWFAVSVTRFVRFVVPHADTSQPLTLRPDQPAQIVAWVMLGTGRDLKCVLAALQ